MPCVIDLPWFPLYRPVSDKAMSHVVQLFGVLKDLVGKQDIKDQDTKVQDIKDQDIKDKDIKDQDTKGQDIKDQDIKDQDTKVQDIKDQDTHCFLLSQAMSSIVGMADGGTEVGVALPLECVLDALK